MSVQRIVLRAVWIKNLDSLRAYLGPVFMPYLGVSFYSLLRGCLGLFLWPVKGLFRVGFYGYLRGFLGIFLGILYITFGLEN